MGKREAACLVLGVLLAGVAMLSSACGDGDGDRRSNSAECGDADVDPGEVCDDGNQISGDGCTASCLGEDGDSVVVDLADGFLEFRYEAPQRNPWCVPVDQVSRLHVIRRFDGSYGLESWIFRRDINHPNCLPAVSTGECIIENTGLRYDLSASDAERLLEAFRRVRILREDAEGDTECDLGTCFERLFSWRSAQAGHVFSVPFNNLAISDASCAPRISREESQRLAAILNALGGGSAEAAGLLQ